MTYFKPKDRVKVVLSNILGGEEKLTQPGIIQTSFVSLNNQLTYVVELSEGFWSKDGGIYVKQLSVHSDYVFAAAE